MNNENTKELIIITWKSHVKIAVDPEKALWLIISSFDEIEDIEVVEYHKLA